MSATTESQAVALDHLINSVRREREIAKLGNDDLADRLLHYIWADLPIGSLESDLMEAAIDRLRKAK